MKKRKINKKFIIILLILFISIGFAYLTATLNITGLAVIKRSVWDVHFENLVNENEDVLNIDIPANITNNNLRVDFEVTLDQPGEEYSFYVDVVNKSTFDVALDTITISGLSQEQESWITPTVTYNDGIILKHNDILKESTRETLRVSVKYNDDLTENNLPTIDNDFTLTVELKYNQADSNSKERNHLKYVNRQTPGKISVGDEISIDTEHFYVVSSDEDKTVLLAKYNLNVGAIYTDSTTKLSDINENDENYGKQNIDAKGWIRDSNRVGTVKFSNNKYWYNNGLLPKYGTKFPANIYDVDKKENSGTNYSIAYYVDNYGEYLNQLGLALLNIRLLNKDETHDCISGSICQILLTNYGFMCNYSYWTGYIIDQNSICGIGSDCGYNCYDYSINLAGTFGVRPVIEINSDYLLGNITLSFDTDAGEETYSSRLVKLGTTYQNLPEPTRDGYTFLGWNGKNNVPPMLIGNCISSSNGQDFNKSTCAATDYVEIDFNNNPEYILSGLTDKVWSFVEFYDENKTPLGRSSGSARKNLVLRESTIQSRYADGEAKYIRVTQYEIADVTTYPISIISEAQLTLNSGTTADIYEPYYITNGTTIVQDKSHTLKAIWQEN